VTAPSEDEQNQRIIAAMFPTRFEQFLSDMKASLWELAEDLVGKGHFRLARVVDFVGDVHDSLEIKLQHRRVRRGRWEAGVPDNLMGRKR